VTSKAVQPGLGNCRSADRIGLGHGYGLFLWVRGDPRKAPNTDTAPPESAGAAVFPLLRAARVLRIIRHPRRHSHPGGACRFPARPPRQAWPLFTR